MTFGAAELAHCVSAPEGNKPRKILISKEEFMQMVVNDEIE